MADDPIVVEVPLPGGAKMALDPTIEKLMDQAFSRVHENWMSQTAREDHAMGWLAENARASFNAAAVMQVQLASGILAQRSAQAQPQEASGIAGSKPVGGA